MYIVYFFKKFRILRNFAKYFEILRNIAKYCENIQILNSGLHFFIWPISQFISKYFERNACRNLSKDCGSFERFRVDRNSFERFRSAISFERFRIFFLLMYEFKSVLFLYDTEKIASK